MLFLLFGLPLSLLGQSDFRWNDGAGSNNWVASGNWNQDPGSGDYPGQKQNNDTVLLYGSFSNNSGKFDIDFTTAGSATKQIISKLEVSTDSANDLWALQDGPQQGTLGIRDAMGFKITGGGSTALDVDIELETNLVEVGVSGAGVDLNGELIGGASRVLDLGEAVRVDSIIVFGSALRLNSTTNDDFTGTIKAGVSKLELGHVNSLRNGTFSVKNGHNGLIYPANAVLGGLEGSGYSLELTDKLFVGNNNGNHLFDSMLTGSAPVVKIGTGTWTLNRANTHTGETEIQDGTVKLGNADALQSSIVNISGPGVLNLNNHNASLAGLTGSSFGGEVKLGNGDLIIHGSSSVFAGAISGSGSVTIDVGIEQLHLGSSSYTGNTILKSGELSVGADNVLGDPSAGVVFDGGTLMAYSTMSSNRPISFASSNGTGTLDANVSGGGQVRTLTWNGLISGGDDNTLFKTQGGTVVLTNNSNTFSGLLNLQGGTLQPTADAVKNATIAINAPNALDVTEPAQLGNLSGSEPFEVDHITFFGRNNADSTYSGAYTGNQNLVKSGTGTWTYNQTAPHTASTNIAAGKLAGNGTFAGSLAVFNGATVSPGNSIGTITATDLVLSGSYECELEAASSDQLVVLNNLDFSNATLNLIYQAGTPVPGTDYVIASYGTLSGGSFASVLNLPANYYIDYAYDLGGNTNNIALVYDPNPPTLAGVHTDTPSLTTSSSVTYSVLFSEAVTNFNAAAIETVPAGVGITVNGSGESYTVDFTGLPSDGTFTWSLDPNTNTIQDAAGKQLDEAFTSDTITLDNTPPDVESTVPSPAGPTNDSLIIFTVTFDENVSDFAAVIPDTTGTVSFESVDVGSDVTPADTWVVTFTGVTGDGALGFSLDPAENAISDAAGNEMTAPYTSPTVTIDNTPPTIVSVTDPPSPTNADLIKYNVIFSEVVYDFDITEVIFSTNDVSYIGLGLGGSTEQRDISFAGVSGDGTVSFSLDPATNNIQDAAGNEMTDAFSSSVTVVDNSAPTVLNITTSADSPTNADSVTFNVTFSEAMASLSGVTNLSTVSSDPPLIGGGDDLWTVTFNNITGDGVLQFQIDPANATAPDLAGNPLGGSSIDSSQVQIDNTPPVITLIGPTTVTIDYGSAWSEAVSADDNVDGSLPVDIGGDEVNSLIPGTYVITYDAIDNAGNAATQRTRTVTVRSQYQTWADNQGLTPGVNDGLFQDADEDGQYNIEEFGTDGNALSNAFDGKRRIEILQSDAQSLLYYTFPVLGAADFLGAPSKTGSIAGITYQVTGGLTPGADDGTITEITPPLDNDMPALSDGYGYRTFRLEQIPGAPAQEGYIRVIISEEQPIAVD